MTANSNTSTTLDARTTAAPSAAAPRAPASEVALLTGGRDQPYAFGLASGLAGHGVALDVIGGDDLDCAELRGYPGLTFLNLAGHSAPGASVVGKIMRMLRYYARLIDYAVRTDTRLFHILWNNKFEWFDRTLLMLFYRWRGKKIVLTVHNVNAGQRDATDTRLNRATLRAQYRLTDHFFVHTEKMKRALVDEFGVVERDVTIIPFGINNAVPETELTAAEARQRLGLGLHERVILFFGNIAPYKGLADLVDAFRRVATRHPDVRLVIAGRAKGGSEAYAADVRRAIAGTIPPGRVIAHLAYVPDEATEVYFKAADVLVLPYTQVFQSGVLFLGYRFGLPVITTDVGSFRDDVEDGRTGFVCRPRDPDDLARTIETYFASDLFENLNARRPEIQQRATTRHSWDVVVEITRDVYGRVLGTP